MTYQTLYSQKKIPLDIATGNGVEIWQRAKDHISDINYVYIIRAFLRVKNTSCLKCEWEDFTNKKLTSARQKIRIFDLTMPWACACSSLADLSVYRTGVYFVHLSNGLWAVETLVV